MRVAISSDGGFVSPHFGRCPGFTLAEIVNGKVLTREEVTNPGHSPGFIPQFLSEKGVQMVVCGGMGTKAQEMFDEMGIRMIMGISGSINEVIKRLEEGVLKGGESLCSPGMGKGYGIDKNTCDHAHK